MTGRFVGRISARHDRGFGWITDETPGSPNLGYSIFYVMKSINGGRYISTNHKITFDLVPDPKHPGRMMAVNIDPVEVPTAFSLPNEIVTWLADPVVAKMFAANDIENTPHISCPVCGSDFVRVDSANGRTGRDETCIGVNGECGHRFNIIFQRHKGIELIRVEAADKVSAPSVPAVIEKAGA